MPDVTSSLRRIVAGALVALGLVVAVAGPAGAHAALVGSTPADGASGETLPSEVAFEFNEPVGNAVVAVIAPDGSSLDVTDTTALDREVTAQVEGADQQGDYTVSYRVVSADGHPIEGSVTFTATTGREVEQQAPPAADEAGFIHRHRTHLFWGVLAVAVAVALFLAPLRRRDDAHDA